MRIVTSEVVVRAPAQMGSVDLTDDLLRAIKDSGVTEGCSVAFCAHTTCNLFINELEDGALTDLRTRLDHLVPGGIYYAHDDFDRRTQNLQPDERSNGRSHVIQMVLGGTSQSIPVSSGEPLLGRWQRLLLLELDEPKDRTCVFQVWGR
ncbi:MAG TPA: secondary thiamine-phosphate synthase enzyme YjbQ [Actinomycetota bacterium]|jgi:secondary thiamine-phosphate synthase enzyme|nr:secondary thiamine-phosphate synthase enzyme YjbQ [Actinomycetota bacterium]